MTKRKPAALPLVAVLDIGSNSVRMTVFRGTKPVFNEKIVCPLGKSIIKTGRLNKQARQLAQEAITGFVCLARAMKVRKIKAVATSAARDAADGKAFVQRLEKDLKITIRLISGHEEARLAAFGVLSGLPKAKGIVADLGGGSLELARIGEGRVKETLTMPLGTLRLAEYGRALPGTLESSLSTLPDLFHTKDPVYLVGGTFRSFARLHMAVTKKFGKLHGYSLTSAQTRKLCRFICKKKPADLIQKFDIEPNRAQALGLAAQLLEAFMDELKPPKLIISTRGLREGLLQESFKRRSAS